SWRDQKTKTSKKVGALRAARVKTGNKKIDLPPLSDLDKKVFGLMGHDYVEGTECADSWPEEQEDNIERLVAGDQGIFDAEPSVLTLRQTTDIDPVPVTINENINDLDELLATVDDNYVVLQPYCEDEFTSKHLLQETSISASIGPSQSTPKSNLQATPISASIGASQSIQKKQMLTNNAKQVKLGNQLQTARDAFSLIAEKEVEANFKIADALTTIATALEKLADNDKKRLENEKLIIEIYTKVIDKL
ncbi:Myb DNA-bind 5 domain-containing protein, partial [Aphis craccivora]